MYKKSKSRAPLFLVILIMGLHFLAYHLSQSSPQKQAEQPTESATFSSTSHAGSYSLVNGTGGCPKAVDWAEYCQGFVLNTVEVDSSFNAEKFCHLNSGPKTTKVFKIYGSEKTKIQVTKEENVIQKRTYVTMVSHGQTATTPQEDTLILGEPGKFLWEHSKAGKGFSCLYAKNSL